jgi:hypothetical protein
MSDKKVNFYDGQIVDEQDLDTEQLYNRTVNSNQTLDFHGSGVVSEKVTYPVIFNKASTDRSTGTPQILDGLAIAPAAQPSDSTFGNQLKVTLSDAVVGTKNTKVFIFGRVYDDSRDSKSSIEVEMLEFDRAESQYTKNYFTSVLNVITQNFFGNATPLFSSSLTNYNYDGSLTPDNSGNTNVWTANTSGVVNASSVNGIFSVSHDSSAYASYILPVPDLRNNRYYKSSTRFKVASATTTTNDALHPSRAATNIWPVFTFDGNKAIGVTLLNEGGVQSVALFDLVDFVENNMLLPSTAVITPFAWNDGDFHVYTLEVSLDTNIVTLTCDSGDDAVTLSALYSSFSTYVGGLAFDLTFNANTYFGFSSGVNGATNTCGAEVDYHNNTIKSEDATECSNDRTQQIVGTLKIEQAEPLTVARDAVIAAQNVSPNIKFRSTTTATDALGNIVEPAFRVYDPDDTTVTVETVVVDAIGGDIYSDDLNEDIITTNVETTTLPPNTSLSTIVGQKFLASTNNIQ